MRYLKLFEEINTQNIKWYHQKLIAELKQVINFEVSEDSNDFSEKSYKDMYTINLYVTLPEHKLAVSLESSSQILEKRKIVTKIIQKWKSKLFRENVILAFRVLDNLERIDLVYKDIYKDRVKPRRFIYHTSNQLNRESILENGLIPKPHSESSMWKNDMSLEYPPAVFATNDDSTWWDGDIWQIDTTKIKNTWFLDLNIQSKYRIMTFEPIPPTALKLITYKSDII